ncbi:MAG: helix-turn-helix domain-containing protein [bacterium]|nr:helix-turn-helix domain-containing protein [bacterium]
MNLKICENLKTFRADQGNTQEELANHLGISIQAVSKWERGESYPDITLLPAIAAYYGRTVDALLGCGEIEQRRKIDGIMKEYQENARKGRIEDCIGLMRGALKEFPGNLSLTASLAYSLLYIGKEEYLDECIDLCEKVLGKSVDDRQRFEVLQNIVYAYGKKGNPDKAREYAEKLPGSYCTQNAVLESVLKGEECRELAQQNIYNYMNLICLSVVRMLHTRPYRPEETVFAYETVVKLFELFLYDGNYGFAHLNLGQLWTDIAQAYAECGNREKTVDALKTACRHAIEADHMEEGKCTSIFADTLSYSGSRIVKNSEMSQTEWILKRMEDPIFDFIRESEEFRQISGRFFQGTKRL